MLTLSGKATVIVPPGYGSERAVVRVVDRDEVAIGPASARLLRTDRVPPGYPVYLARQGEASYLKNVSQDAIKVILPDSFDYLEDGDVLGFWNNPGSVRTLYRRASKHNGFLVIK